MGVKAAVQSRELTCSATFRIEGMRELEPNVFVLENVPMQEMPERAAMEELFRMTMTESLYDDIFVAVRRAGLISILADRMVRE